MHLLAELERPALVDGLAPLAAGYRTWISQQEARINDPEEHLAGISRRRPIRLLQPGGQQTGSRKVSYC